MRTILAALGLLALTGLHAQDSALVFPPRSNVVKLGMTSGLASTVSLCYERVFNDEFSAAMTVSYMVPRRPNGFLDLQTDKLDLSSGRELTGWFFTPEVKWYLEKDDVRPAPRGFYVGAYARASDLRMTAEMTGTASDPNVSGSIQGDLQVDLLEYGLGVDAGYQLLMLHDRVAIDFVFFGPRWSLYTLKVQADLDGDGELGADLQQALEDAIGHNVVPINVEVNTKGSASNTTNSFGYRFGFKVGYCF